MLQNSRAVRCIHVCFAEHRRILTHVCFAEQLFRAKHPLSGRTPSGVVSLAELNRDEQAVENEHRETSEGGVRECSDGIFVAPCDTLLKPFEDIT